METEDWFLRVHRERVTNTLKVVFTDCINNLLIGRHILLSGITMEMLRFYDGLLGLARANTPLWVFSLNHDVMLELAAARLGIPVSGGFSDERLNIRLSPAPNGESRHVAAEVIRNAHLKSRTLNFFKRGTVGINLQKIHGALDIFTFNEGNDVLRMLPQGGRPDGILESLYDFNLPSSGPRTGDGRFATDTNGNEIFLRTSLVSGAHKFDAQHSQVLPMDYLQIFETSLLQLETLICIGYSFGDLHINLHIKGWLELSRSKRLIIVGPNCDVPAAFAHLEDRIECKRMTTTDFLQAYATAPLTPEDVQIKARGEILLAGINSHPPAWAYWNRPEAWVDRVKAPTS